jgi:hypothetical protein
VRISNIYAKLGWKRAKRPFKPLSNCVLPKPDAHIRHELRTLTQFAGWRSCSKADWRATVSLAQTMGGAAADCGRSAQPITRLLIWKSKPLTNPAEDHPPAQLLMAAIVADLAYTRAAKTGSRPTLVKDHPEAYILDSICPIWTGFHWPSAECDLSSGHDNLY